MDLLTPRAFFIYRVKPLGCLITRSCLSFVLIVNCILLAACRQLAEPALSAAPTYQHYPETSSLAVSTAFGADGRLWRVVPGKQHVYVDYSTDFGKTFSSPVQVNSSAQKIKTISEDRPSIAVDNAGRILVIYPAEDAQPLTLFYSISTDHGQSFSSPKPLSNKAAEANTFEGELLATSSGGVHVFWHDERDRNDWKQPGNAVYYRYFNDSLDFSSEPLKLADSLCECCRLASALDDRQQPLVMARFIYPGGTRDHGLIKRQGSGQPAVTERVTFDQWTIEACPEHGPAIAVDDQGYYHIAWFTQGAVRQGLFYAYSSDRGRHFSVPMAIGHSERLPGHADVIAVGKRIFLSWNEFDGHASQLQVMQSGDAGKTWSKPQTIAESSAESDFPFLLRYDQHVFVSWNSKAEGYRLFALP